MSTLRSKLKVPMAIWFCTIMQPRTAVFLAGGITAKW